MKKETLKKESAGQASEELSGESNQSTKPSGTDGGAITKSSDGPGHTTKENQTTSTGSPRIPVSPDFLERLGEIHDGEKRLTHALPILKLAATSEDLKTLLGVHLEETKGHVTSLDELVDSLGEKLPSKKCQAIADMIWDGEIEVIKKVTDSRERDAAIIAAGRKVEQFEIHTYKSLCTMAEENDWTHEFAVLTSILNQETLADELLAGVAEGKEPLTKLIEKVSLAHAKSGVEPAKN